MISIITKIKLTCAVSIYGGKKESVLLITDIYWLRIWCYVLMSVILAAYFNVQHKVF